MSDRSIVATAKRPSSDHTSASMASRSLPVSASSSPAAEKDSDGTTYRYLYGPGTPMPLGEPEHAEIDLLNHVRRRPLEPGRPGDDDRRRSGARHVIVGAADEVVDQFRAANGHFGQKFRAVEQEQQQGKQQSHRCGIYH